MIKKVLTDAVVDTATSYVSSGLSFINMLKYLGYAVIGILIVITIAILYSIIF